MSAPQSSPSTIASSMLYHNAPEAIEWLCRAFGFEKHLVVPGDPGIIHHAQLTYGNGMIMLGSAETARFGDDFKSPRQLDGVGTQVVCVRVNDADAHHAQALAEGSEIVQPLVDNDYGGRGYSCRDPEGHVWHFGTYNPWQST